jgi:hypothetical protein
MESIFSSKAKVSFNLPVRSLSSALRICAAAAFSSSGRQPSADAFGKYVVSTKASNAAI